MFLLGVTHTQTFASTITPAPGNWFAMPNEWKHVPGITMAAFQASKALAEVQPPSLSTWCSMSKLYSFVDIKSRGLPKQGNWNEEGGNSPPCCGVCLLGAEEAKMIFWPTPGPKNISILATDSFTLCVSTLLPC